MGRILYDEAQHPGSRIRVPLKTIISPIFPPDQSTEYGSYVPQWSLVFQQIFSSVRGPQCFANFMAHYRLTTPRRVESKIYKTTDMGELAKAKVTSHQGKSKVKVKRISNERNALLLDCYYVNYVYLLVRNGFKLK